MFAKVQTGTKANATIRQVTVANQNLPLATVAPYLDEPQWYDVKFLAERMVDMRQMVRGAVINRRRAELLKQNYAHASARQIVTAEIHAHSMDIALGWHDYRLATAAYHAAWHAYQANLRR